jgi:hypothetical protein
MSLTMNWSLYSTRPKALSWSHIAIPACSRTVKPTVAIDLRWPGLPAGRARPRSATSERWQAHPPAYGKRHLLFGALRPKPRYLHQRPSSVCHLTNLQESLSRIRVKV